MFGFSADISADGTVVAGGAPYHEGFPDGRGHVRSYKWTGDAWVQRGADIDGDHTGDKFGWQVALSDDGTIVAASAILNDDGGTNAGQVRVYEW